jgi:hypothetical protein
MRPRSRWLAAAGRLRGLLRLPVLLFHLICTHRSGRVCIASRARPRAAHRTCAAGRPIAVVGAAVVATRSVGASGPARRSGAAVRAAIAVTRAGPAVASAAPAAPAPPPAPPAPPPAPPPPAANARLGRRTIATVARDLRFMAFLRVEHVACVSRIDVCATNVGP